MAHPIARLAGRMLAAACTVVATAAPAATVAFYAFENGTAGQGAYGKRSILDSSGNGLHGTPYDKPVYVSTDNPDSTLALRFDGSASSVFVPDDPKLQLTHSLTLEAYVFLRHHASIGMIVIRGDNRYDYDPFYMLVDNDYLVFLVERTRGEGSVVKSPSPLPEKQWIHVAGTLDDATGIQSLYVNGVRVDSATTTIRPFATLKQKNHPGLGIGSNIAGSPDPAFFHGAIDDVRISDVALDPSQFLPPP